jgi:hypothetical protein
VIDRTLVILRSGDHRQPDLGVDGVVNRWKAVAVTFDVDVDQVRATL